MTGGEGKIQICQSSVIIDDFRIAGETDRTVMNINAAVLDIAAVIASVIMTFAVQYVLERFTPNLAGKNGL